MDFEKMNGIKLVFDIDDTICNNKNRDYENAEPKQDVIDKINKLHDQGATITLYTSRGMVSCNGDLEKIVAKNKTILEKWLDKNNVKYDNLIFGKPLGDMYIDDKAMNVKDFLKQDFEILTGKSGYKVIRLGNIVKKEMSDENYKKLMNWYKKSDGIAKNPAIISNLYSTIYIEYIDGDLALNCLDFDLLNKLIAQIETFGQKKYAEFDKEIIYDKLDKHKSDTDIEWNKIVENCKEKISNLSMNKFASLSHQDFTLSNIIKKGEEVYLLDSLFDERASSYLLDFAKLKMSLDGYEERFLGYKKPDEKYLKYFENYLQEKGILEYVNIFEYMYIIRLYKYNDNKEKVKEFAKYVRRNIK